ncbi:MAG: hypothetical protein M3177_09900, partial [Pseudomonadota bacterium]|nr:hypothetical protein [Pseudomonadota bacterium]
MRAAGPGLTHSYDYDALGRMVSDTGPQGTVSYRYGLAGRRSRTTYPEGFFVEYDYLHTGETTAIRENGATSGAGVLATFGYDQMGRRTSLTRGNGTVTNYSYDPVSRLTQLTQNLAGDADDLTLGFGYNPASQIVSNTRSNDAYSFTGHVNENVTDNVNHLNQVTQTGTTGISYGLAGNVREIGPAAYAYTSENLMASAPGLTLAYDPLMRLYETNTGTSATTRRFLYDGANMIAEYDGDGVLKRRYVHGPGVDEPIAYYTSTATSSRRWLHADERGSIIAVSDAAGAVAAVNRYDEYGNPQGGAITGRFGYTGQAWLPELGMYYYRA